MGGGIWTLSRWNSIVPINNCKEGIVTCGSKLDLMVTD